MVGNSMGTTYPATIVAGTFATGGAERQAFLLAIELAKVGISATVVSFQPKPRQVESGPDISREFPGVPVEYLAPWYFHPARFVSRSVRGLFLGQSRSSLPSDTERAGSVVEHKPPRLRRWVSELSKGRQHNQVNLLLAGLASFRLLALIETWSLIRWVKKSHSALVISFLPDPNAASILTGLTAKVPVVASERNDVDKSLQPERIRWIRQTCYPHADLITANTEFAVKQLQESLPEKTIVWQPNQQSFLPPELPLRAISFDLNVVSRLVAHKRVHSIIEALAALHSSGHCLTLNIYGEGPEEDRLKAFTLNLGLSKYVHFHGYVPVSEIYGSSREPGIYVTNSEYEGSSNSLHEAVASGFLPVVANSVTEVFDIISEPLARLLVTDGTSNDIAEKISGLVNSQVTGHMHEDVVASFVKYWSKSEHFLEEFLGTCRSIASGEREL